MPQRPSVLVADDDIAFRRAVRDVLHSYALICAEADDRTSTVRRALAMKPDLCLIDAGLPGGAGEASRIITSESSRTAVIFATDHHRDATLLMAARAGAIGYVVKDDLFDLPRVVNAVVAGEAAIPRRFVARLVAELRLVDSACSGEGARLSSLTAREREVLERLCDGDTTTDIAESMYVAPVTVRTHVAAVVRKLAVADREEAVNLLRNVSIPQQQNTLRDTDSREGRWPDGHPPHST